MFKNNDPQHFVCFVKTGEAYFIAKVTDASHIGGEQTWVMQVLKVLIEVIEETIGIEKLRDNSHSVHMLLDTILDHGYPLLMPAKPLLVALLQPPSSQAMAMLGKVISAGSVNDKHSNLLNAVTTGSNTWRWQETAPTSGMDVDSISSGLVKDVYLDLNEYISGVYQQSLTSN